MGHNIQGKSGKRRPAGPCSCGKVSIKRGLDFVWEFATGITHWRDRCVGKQDRTPQSATPAAGGKESP